MALCVRGYAVRTYECMWFGRTANSKSLLPPTLSIVVHNGCRPWNAAQCLSA